MQVAQIYNLVNTVTTEITGQADLVKEDLSNIVDVGKTVLSNTDVDNYVRSLMNRIGKTIFSDRKYSGLVPSVLIDSWEFGSIMQKIGADIPDAVENDSWNLQNGSDYSPDVFYKPTVTQKLFNSKVTFEINLSFTDKQVRESFDSTDQLNAFLTMLYTSVENSLTLKIDSLILRCINNLASETIKSDYGTAGLDSKSGIKAVNLLYLYNQSHNTSLTVDDILVNPDFIKFATLTINNYRDRLASCSTLFNVEGKKRFTPKDKLHTVLLSDFVNASDVYVMANSYHNEKLALPTSDHVPYWQGSGTSYDFDSISKIHVKNSSGDDVEVSGIIGVMFDHDSLAVCNSDKRVTTNYNPRGEFYTNFYKFDCSYINDLSENFVVFFVA